MTGKQLKEIGIKLIEMGRVKDRRDFAKALGIKNGHLYKIERGDSPVTNGILEILEHRFKIKDGQIALSSEMAFIKLPLNTPEMANVIGTFKRVITTWERIAAKPKIAAVTNPILKHHMECIEQCLYELSKLDKEKV
jgi:hypothetical protein